MYFDRFLVLKQCLPAPGIHTPNQHWFNTTHTTEQHWIPPVQLTRIGYMIVKLTSMIVHVHVYQARSVSKVINPLHTNKKLGWYTCEKRSVRDVTQIHYHVSDWSISLKLKQIYERKIKPTTTIKRGLVSNRLARSCPRCDQERPLVRGGVSESKWISQVSVVTVYADYMYTSILRKTFW